MPASHNQLVVDQFGKQAAHFARLPGHQEATRLLIELAELAPADHVLDVACGPGLVACAVAPCVRHVVGVDLTPAMIDKAVELQSQQGLSNLDWLVGDMSLLPFANDQFSAALMRYSLHHVLDPLRAVSEMVRVVRPGGRVVVADLVLPVEQGRAYDRVERLRDPSHVGVLSNAAFAKLMTHLGLIDLRWTGYLFELELNALLQGSFPQPGDAERVRDLFERDIGVNCLGVGIHRREGEVWLAYPIAIAAGRKPDHPTNN